VFFILFNGEVGLNPFGMNTHGSPFAKPVIQIILSDGPRAMKHHGILRKISQLSNVPGPPVFLENSDSSGIELGYCNTIVLGIKLQEMVEQ
jgi:hypothetical protein